MDFFFCCWSKWEYKNDICCCLPFTSIELYPMTTSASENHRNVKRVRSQSLCCSSNRSLKTSKDSDCTRSCTVNLEQLCNSLWLSASVCPSGAALGEGGDAQSSERFWRLKISRQKESQLQKLAWTVSL